VDAGGTQFTCFTGTKEQILTLVEKRAAAAGRGPQFTCFTGTNVQILTL
jgi:hypothetical protein